MPILSQSAPAANPLPLPPAPPALQPILLAWLAPLLAWLSAAISQAVLTRCARHPLLRLARSGYDPAPVVAACAAYRHAAGPGAPATYSINTLVRAEIVRLWAGSCSDYALERLLAADLVVRWFCGLALLDPTPDHSTLNRFHAWCAAHASAALFSDVLTFLDRVDPEDPAATPQIVDTFALASPAAAQDARTILAHLGRQVVALWPTVAPPDLCDPLAPLDLSPLTARLPHFTAAERLATLRTLVAWATALDAALRPHLGALDPAGRAALGGLLDLLAKVVADETLTDATGQVVERPLGAKGTYRLGSAVDPEATFRKHDPDPAVLGYNAAIATTTTRIRAAVALPGSTPDSAAPVALLGQEAAAGQPLPPQLIMDRAGGWGKTRAEVEATSGGQTVMVARLPPAGGADPTRFGPADFGLTADQSACTCPNGVVSTKAYASGEGDGVHFRFTAGQCAGCPLWDRCRVPDSDPKGHRTVYVSPYAGHLAAAAAFNTTAAGRELLAERWRVEPTIAWLVRYDGARRARRVGQAAAQFQLYQACAIRNLWRWLGRVARRAGPGRARAAAGAEVESTS